MRKKRGRRRKWKAKDLHPPHITDGAERPQRVPPWVIFRPAIAAIAAMAREHGITPLYTVLALAAAHVFIMPLLYLAATVAAAAAFGSTALLASLVLAAAYGVASRFVKRSEWFKAVWLPCHGYFPVTTLVWDGKEYSEHLTDGHRQLYGIEEAQGGAKQLDGKMVSGGGAGGAEDASEVGDMRRRKAKVVGSAGGEAVATTSVEHGVGVTGGKQYVFGIHPHGPIPLCASILIPQLTKFGALGQRMRYAAASAVFAVPFAREFYIAMGCVEVSSKSCTKVLSEGHNLALLPGGIEEMLLVPPADGSVEPLVLHKRLGFVRLALRHGASLVPVFGFGERRAYKISRSCLGFRKKLQDRFRIGIPMFSGRMFTLMPHPKAIRLVVGKPIDLPKLSGNIPDEVTRKYLQQYVEAVKGLYEEHKREAGYQDITLEIQ